jgi:hypothetical protein
MEESTSSIPTVVGSFAVENAAPEPRRSGRVRSSTQRFEFKSQPTSSSSKSSGKRKRSNTTQDEDSDRQQDDKKTHAQARATNTKSRATTTRVANNKSTKSDDANAKPITKSRPSQHAGDVVDLTEEDDATSSKKPKRTKSGESEEKRLKQ